jgi:hypothetical protein
MAASTQSAGIVRRGIAFLIDFGLALALVFVFGFGHEYMLTERGLKKGGAELTASDERAENSGVAQYFYQFANSIEDKYFKRKRETVRSSGSAFSDPMSGEGASSGQIEWFLLQRAFTQRMPGSIAAILLIPLLFSLVCTMILGASFGKVLTGLRVRNDHGEKAGIGSMVIRYFVKWVFPGYFMAFSNDKGKALHDNVAGTMVVSR